MTFTKWGVCQANDEQSHGEGWGTITSTAVQSLTTWGAPLGGGDSSPQQWHSIPEQGIGGEGTRSFLCPRTHLSKEALVLLCG